MIINSKFGLRSDLAQIAQTSKAHRRRLRDAYGDFLERRNWSHLVTFNFGYGIDPSVALTRMKGFCASLERKALGRNYYRHRGDDRLCVVGFQEHLHSNIHWHALAYASGQMSLMLRHEGNDMWRRTLPRGQLHVELLKSEKRASSYIRKDLHKGNALDAVFIYSEIHRKNTVK